MKHSVSAIAIAVFSLTAASAAHAADPAAPAAAPADAPAAADVPAAADEDSGNITEVVVTATKP